MTHTKKLPENTSILPTNSNFHLFFNNTHTHTHTQTHIKIHFLVAIITTKINIKNNNKKIIHTNVYFYDFFLKSLLNSAEPFVGVYPLSRISCLKTINSINKYRKIRIYYVFLAELRDSDHMNGT